MAVTLRLKSSPIELRTEREQIMLSVKALGLWLILVMIAILNAGLREHGFNLWFPTVALPLSGITLSIGIFCVTYLSMPIIKRHDAFAYWFIGIFWLFLTLSFEFIFGHYVRGMAWSELLAIFKIHEGNFMLLVFAVTLLSPYLTAQWRGLLRPA